MGWDPLSKKISHIIFLVFFDESDEEQFTLQAYAHQQMKRAAMMASSPSTAGEKEMLFRISVNLQKSLEL